MIVWLALFLFVTATMAQTQAPKPTSIVYGQPAQTGQFPYQVFLELYRQGQPNSYCSGSLISDQWILSAAHCFPQVYRFVAAMGTITPTNPPDPNWVALAGTEYYVHEKYDPIHKSNDVAVLKLPLRLLFGPTIAPIQLATDSQQNHLGDIAVSSGWGKTRDADAGITANLQFTTMKVISNQECFFLYPSLISPTSLCAGGSRGSTCRGDSGGPLVSLKDGKQIGISSFGMDSCEKSVPQAFTRVSSFIGWIRGKTGLAL